MGFTNNDNIIYSNLWKDGLHLNDGGVRNFSGNLSTFIEYCKGCISHKNNKINRSSLHPRKRKSLKMLS